MDGGSYNGKNIIPPGLNATPTDPIKEGSPDTKHNNHPGEYPATPNGLNERSFDGHAADPDGVKQAGERAAALRDSNPAYCEQISQARADYAEAKRHYAADEPERKRWIAIRQKAKAIRRRAIGEPELRDAGGRVKLDACKALLLAVAVAVLLLTELLGATSLTQSAPWSFIDESWGRAALLSFPFVVASYVQLRNAVKSLRGRHERAFERGLVVVGVAVALIGLVCLGISLGDAHRETESLRPPEPLVPYAALTCLSMVGAALSLVVVEGWLQQKIEACRPYVETLNPAYERANRQVDRLTELVGKHERRAIRAQCELASLAKDRQAWVAWAESEVRRRQHDSAKRRRLDEQRRRLVEAKRRAESELDAFES